jgi:bifunctional UDP-N-acetylglucosamine pyrophosphorylase/glucosamine-1-phosphate N-acetyltransferase
MQIVILAAGRGKRMSNLTDKTPKPMLMIKNKPILEYKLDNLPPEIKEVVFVVGYRGDKIEKHFGDNFRGRKITYVVQDVLDGTGGALRLVKDVVGERFLVMMGDDLYHKDDLKRLLKYDNATLAAKTATPEKFGVLEIDQGGNFSGIVEKSDNPPSNLVNTGLYIMTRNFFDYDLVRINEKEFGLPQTLARMAQSQPIKIIETEKWFPVGSPEDLKSAEKVLENFF